MNSSGVDTTVNAAPAVHSKSDHARVDATVDTRAPIIDGPCNVSSLPRVNTPPVRGHSNWRTLLLRADVDWPLPTNDSKFDQESIAAYSLTSGTTGLPKTALISHRSVVAQAALLEDQFGARPYQVLSTAPSKHHRTHTDTCDSHHSSSACLSFMRLHHPWRWYYHSDWAFRLSSCPNGPYRSICEQLRRTP
jgi:acyl-CoA synthetase (AMP-forming)/AMP-acid ligase II